MEPELLTASILFAAAGATTMILMCLALVRWWHREVTTTALAISCAVLVAVLPSVLHSILGIAPGHSPTDNGWFGWYRVGSDDLIGVVEFWRAWVIYKVQRRS